MLLPTMAEGTVTDYRALFPLYETTPIEEWLNSTVPWLYRQFAGRIKEASALDPSGSILLLFTGLLIAGYVLQAIIAIFFKSKWDSIREKSLDSQQQMIRAVTLARKQALAAREAATEVAVTAQKTLSMKFEQVAIKELLRTRASE